MKGEFPDDTFTENDVLLCLESQNLHYKNSSRYILSQCPTHEDTHPSVQIYKDDWFVNCHAGCGRYHITKAFPQLRENVGGTQGSHGSQSTVRRQANPVNERKYTTYDLMEYWKSLPLIPRDHQFKTIELETLDDLGWRWVAEYNQYFIPYFSRSKESIPFGQYRNLDPNKPRFIFLKDAKPTCYGTWNLEPDEKIFIVEGASDAAVLDYCGVPWIALPSAASVELMKSMATFAIQNGIELVYAGDNDEAGDKLKDALDMTAPYRLKQPPKEYKDWGDFLVGAGRDAVVEYTHRELYPKPINMTDTRIPMGIRELWPDARVVYDGNDFTKKEEPVERKEQSLVLPMEF
jgi:hypothetical protein